MLLLLNNCSTKVELDGRNLYFTLQSFIEQLQKYSYHKMYIA